MKSKEEIEECLGKHRLKAAYYERMEKVTGDNKYSEMFLRKLSIINTLEWVLNGDDNAD